MADIAGKVSSSGTVGGSTNAPAIVGGGVGAASIIRGQSAYEVAVANGFRGSEAEWLEALKGKDGKSAYQYAVEGGYKGTEEDFMKLLGSVGSGGIVEEKDPTVPAWAKQPEKPKYTADEVGAIPADKLPSAIDTALAEAKQSGMFDGAPGLPGENGKTPYILNGYWYIDGINTNVKAEGVDGKGIKSFAKTSGNGAAGTTDTYTMTFTDNTTFAMTVYNGKDGYTPQKNVDYFDGNDGVSPTVSVSKSGKVTTITITDKSGTKTATINDGVDGDNGEDATANYGVCSTAAGTAAKVVTVDGFELKAGEVVTVKFTATNSAANPTLNVNSTGAYAIIYKGNSIAAYSAFGVGALEADKLYQFVFTGSNYELVGGLHVDRLAGTNAGYAKSGGDIDFSAGVGTLKDGVVPVKSVNGKTGAVVLGASDVGARPNTWTPSYSDVGADKSGAASSAVSTHNTNTSAHNDIRLLIEGLVTRLDALANSDDTTLDQMAEVVKYIKDNRDLISQITTDKVSVSDIVNNLTTNVSNRPLSAAQGVALKALIDAITVPTKLSELSGDSTHRLVTDSEKSTWNNKSNFSGSYNDLTGKPTIPTVPTKVSAFENDKGYLTGVPSGYAKTADHYTKTESDNKYQAKGNYLTSVPSEYVTETELTAKGYAVKSAAETWTFTLEDGSTVTKKVVLA